MSVAGSGPIRRLPQSLKRREPVWPSGKAVSGRTSVRYRFGSPFSSKVVVCGHGLVTLSLTINETLKMALIAAHVNAGHSGGDSVVIGIYSSSSPTSIPLPPILPVPNKPYGFCGR